MAAAIVIIIIVAGGGVYYFYTSSTPAPTKSIGVVFDVGGRGDLSFNDMAALGADTVAKQYNLQEQFLQSSDSSAYVTNLRTLASQPNPPILIVAVGFLMGDAVNQTARQFPKQNFAIIDSAVPGLPNVLGINFKTNEGAAVAGVLAAAVSDCYSKLGQGSNKVGLVLGIEIPVLWTFEIGYKWGISWAENNSQQYLSHPILNNAPVKNVVLYKYTGTFGDPATGKAEALNEFNAGAVVSYNVAGATGNGIFDAAKALAKNPNMGPPFGIGVDSDQDWVAPGLILASQMKRVDIGVEQATQMALNGSFTTIVKNTGGVLTLGMASGDVAISTLNDLTTFLQIATSAGKTGLNQTAISNTINAMRTQVTKTCGDVYGFANQLASQIKSGAVTVPYVLTQDQVNLWRTRYG
ncbi:MAG: BMP family ABC transporter substrate-binding protein [Nitrososphaerales archaeon]|nr:BMP family ABC transporter substrate-binding protein [Nitrososphaerales archaeon]